MRSSAALFHSTPTPESASASAAFSPPATIQRSQWRSPVPYLFGGLTAMLGLIAFALLILACSYWKLSGRVARDADVESGAAAAKVDGGPGADASTAFEEKLLVIMAGHAEPTFLATPTPSINNCSFNDEKINSGRKSEKNEENDEKQKHENVFESKLNQGSIQA